MAVFTLSKYRALAKGFRGRAKNCGRIMIPKVHKVHFIIFFNLIIFIKALMHAYRNRKLKRRVYK